MKNIIELYQRFSKYKNNTYQELYQHITPSMNLNQYKVFQDEQGTYGFVNWALLNDTTEQQYKKTGKLNKDEYREKCLVVRYYNYKKSKRSYEMGLSLF